MANDKASIKVGIQLDEAEAARLLANMEAIENGLDDLQRKERIAADLARGQQSQGIANRGEQFEIADQKLQALLETARQYGKEEMFMTTLITKGEREAQLELEKTLGIQQKSNALTKDQIRLIQARATELRHESIALRRGAADLQLFSQAALVTGTATIVSVTAIAKEFASAFKEGNSLAAKFNAEMNRLKTARLGIGETFAREMLPFIREATSMVEKVGAFVRAHPQIVPFAIKTAEVLIAAGVIGKSIAMAARLTADFLAIQSSIMRLIAARAAEQVIADKQIAAAQLQGVAADKQLAAAEIQAADIDTGGATAAAAGAGLSGALRWLTTPGGIAALIGANVLAANSLSNNLEKLQQFLNQVRPGFGNQVDVIAKTILKNMPGGGIFGLVDAVKEMRSALERFVDRLAGERTGRTATSPAGRINIEDIVPGSIELSEHLDEMLDAYEQYKADDLALVQDHYEKRTDIIEEGLRALADENERYAKEVADIREDLAATLRKLNRDYQKQIIEDQEKYEQDRVDAIQDAHEDILRMQEDLAEKLRKMDLEHAMKRAELIAQRDALGLVKEQRRYEFERAEAQRDVDIEIQRRREELARRLAELDREFAELKARRAEEHAERIAEAQEQAAERLEQAAEEHKERMEKIREETAERLAEEDRRYAEERKRLYEQFVRRLRDLDAFYLGELNLERQRRSEMIAELDAFLQQYRLMHQQAYADIKNQAEQEDTGSVGHRASGGYVGKGVYQVGEQGREFVLSNATTRAAEQAISGGLNQQNILAAIKGKSVVWNDHRRFDSSLSASERRQINDDTVRIIQEALA